MTVSLLHSVPADGSFSAAGAAAWGAQHVFTQATDRLLGRTTAGVGATEEISVGAGLTLSGGTLVNAGATSPIGGSDTQVQFNDGGVFAGNANFTFNKATNQIAIAAGTAAAPTLIPTGDTNTGIWFPAADTIAASTGGTERIRILSSGNVGIGTTAPGARLQVNSEIRVADGTTTLRSITSSGISYFGNITDHTIVVQTNNAERIRILNTGNVGIGTSSPDALLSVNGVASFGAGTAALPSVAAFGDLDTGMWFPAANQVAWSTGGSERARITSSGLSIGTAASSRMLTVLSSQIVVGLLQSTNASNTSLLRFLDATNTNETFAAAIGSAGTSLMLYGGGAERVRIDSSGNIGIGTTTFGTSAVTVLAIATGTAPTTGPADTIQIYSTDLSAGNTMLSLYTEGTVVNANTTAAATHRIAIRVNGTVYYLLANTAA
jgi:hypothetical protein